MLTDALAIVAAYALGSIPVAWLAVRRWAHVDVRRVGSGNVGAANALRATTPAIGLLVALADAAKGAGAVWLARRTHASDAAVALAAVASVVGHVAPIWLRFRGGKGVATASGAFAVLAPLAAAAAVGRLRGCRVERRAWCRSVRWRRRWRCVGDRPRWHEPAFVKEAAAAVADRDRAASTTPTSRDCAPAPSARSRSEQARCTRSPFSARAVGAPRWPSTSLGSATTSGSGAATPPWSRG